MTTADIIAKFDKPTTYHVPMNSILSQEKADSVIGLKPPLAPMFNWMDDAHNANKALGPRIQDDIEKLTHEKNEQKAQIAFRQNASVGRGLSTNDEKEIAGWWKDIAKIDATIARLHAKKKAAQDVYNPLHHILIAIDKARGGFVLADVAVTVPPGSSALKEAEIRFADAMAKTELARVTFANTSPMIDEMVSKMRRDVETRATENTPDYRPLFRQHIRGVNAPPSFGSVKWPIDYVAEAKGERGKLDAIGLFWWLNCDVICDKAEAEIRSQYIPERAMSSEARNAAIAGINAEALALWYEAGAFAELAAVDGVFVSYPQSMPPLAIVGLREV